MSHIGCPVACPPDWTVRYAAAVTAILVGYARCLSDDQDLEANRMTLLELGVPADRIHLDRARPGTTRARPGLDRALAAVRPGDTLVVPKLDRLARSLPDARTIGGLLAEGRVRLQLGSAVYDPADPMGAAAVDDDKVIYLFVADSTTLADEGHPLLAVDLNTEPGRTFRVPVQLYADVSTNLSIANMDFAEFADAVDATGTYRGFD